MTTIEYKLAEIEEEKQKCSRYIFDVLTDTEVSDKKIKECMQTELTVYAIKDDDIICVANYHGKDKYPRCSIIRKDINDEKTTDDLEMYLLKQVYPNSIIIYGTLLNEISKEQ
jgi:hypothetical protein